MIEKLNLKKIEKHGLSTNELFNKINEMISDINANSYLNSENTIEMDNIIKRLELLEKKEGNSVAQQTIKKDDIRLIIQSIQKNDLLLEQYKKELINKINSLKARTTDKEQPE